PATVLNLKPAPIVLTNRKVEIKTTIQRAAVVQRAAPIQRVTMGKSGIVNRPPALLKTTFKTTMKSTVRTTVNRSTFTPPAVRLVVPGSTKTKTAIARTTPPPPRAKQLILPDPVRQAKVVKQPSQTKVNINVTKTTVVNRNVALVKMDFSCVQCHKKG